MVGMQKSVVRIGPACQADFFLLHSSENQCGWCFCVAWWVTTWEAWGERTEEENRKFRESLFEGGEYDGYLLYVDKVPAGWCQVGRRDRLEKLVRDFKLDLDPDTWAITCFQIAPEYRRKGLATYMLGEVLKDLRIQGIHRVEAFPKRGISLDEFDLWNGPERIFLAAGFQVIREDLVRPVLAIELRRKRQVRGR